MRLSVTLANTAGWPWIDQLRLARAAERLGYDTVWVPESYSWEAFAQLGAIAMVTERIKLGTAAVNVFSRSPALLGQCAATLDRVSAGRFTLGLGVSGPQVVTGWHGVPFERPLRRLRETVEVVRTVVARERLTFEGDVYTLRGGLKLVNQPVRDRVPVYLATLTRGGLELAGELADGWLGAFLSPAHYRSVFEPHLGAGLARRSPLLPEMQVCVCQQVAVSADRAAARDTIRGQLALYVGAMGSREQNFYNRLFCEYGFEEEAARVQALYRERRRGEAAAAVTDAMVDAVAIVGAAGDCTERLSALAALGVHEVAVQLSTPDGGVDSMLSALKALAPR